MLPIADLLHRAAGDEQQIFESCYREAELSWWYQFYFATERGQRGYEANRKEFAKLIWHSASPEWTFHYTTFKRSAQAFDNPDHVAIVIHNYRWRLGAASGDPKYDALEKRLAEAPNITVPTITLEGDANGAPHPGPLPDDPLLAKNCRKRTLVSRAVPQLPLCLDSHMSGLCSRGIDPWPRLTWFQRLDL